MHAAIYTHANFFALMVSVNLEVAVCAWSKHGDGQMDEVSVTRKPFPLWTVCTHAYMGIWLWVEHDKNMTLLPRLVSPAFLLCDELQLGSRRFCIHVFSLFLRRPRRSRATVAYIFFVFGRQICSWKKKVMCAILYAWFILRENTMEEVEKRSQIVISEVLSMVCVLLSYVLFFLSY